MRGPRDWDGAGGGALRKVGRLVQKRHRPGSQIGESVGGDRRHWTPLSRALDALGDRWTLLIMVELIAGPLRVGDLLERMPGITQASLNRHLRDMATYGLVSRQRRELKPRIEYELTESGRDLLSVLRGLSRWGMRWAWSEPGREECLELDMLIGHLPLLLDSDQLPSGLVELVIERTDRPARHLVNLDRGKVSVLQTEQSQAMPWSRIVGNDLAWVEALGPRRSQKRLDISGDAALAGALLGALPKSL